MFGNELDIYIKNHVYNILKNASSTPEEPKDVICTDNLAEIIEKLIIIHIRQWVLEDALVDCKNDSEYADIKRKIDVCFKKKRPAMIEAINKLISEAIISNKKIEEENVKFYKTNY
jgi:hypothetical protein